MEYPEISKAEAEKLVATYNKEGVDAGYGRSGSGKGGNQRSGGYYGRGRGNFQSMHLFIDYYFIYFHFKMYINFCCC